MPRPFPTVPHPDVAIENQEKRVTRQYRDLLLEIVRRLPVTGEATFAAGTSVAVTFSAPEMDATYKIALLDLPADNRFWVSGKSVTGFTINAASSNSDSIGWALLRT